MSNQLEALRGQIPAELLTTMQREASNPALDVDSTPLLLSVVSGELDTPAAGRAVFYAEAIDGAVTVNAPTGLVEGSTYLWDLSLAVGASLTFDPIFKWGGGTPPTVPDDARSLISALCRGGVLIAVATTSVS